MRQAEVHQLDARAGRRRPDHLARARHAGRRPRRGWQPAASRWCWRCAGCRARGSPRVVPDNRRGAQARGRAPDRPRPSPHRLPRRLSGHRSSATSGWTAFARRSPRPASTPSARSVVATAPTARRRRRGAGPRPVARRAADRRALLQRRRRLRRLRRRCASAGCEPGGDFAVVGFDDVQRGAHCRAAAHHRRGRPAGPGRARGADAC